MTLDARNTIGLSIFKFRERLGISQEEAAFRCGLSLRTYGNVERGIENFEIKTLEKIVKGLGMVHEDFERTD